MNVFKRPRTSDRWRSLLISGVLCALLLTVVLPELRVLLVIVDIIGVDLYLLLCLAQLRSCGPMVGTVAIALAGRVIALSARLASAAGWIARALVPRDGVWVAGNAMGAACLSMPLVLVDKAARRRVRAR